MNASVVTSTAAFVLTGSLVLAAGSLFDRRRSALAGRIDDLAGHGEAGTPDGLFEALQSGLARFGSRLMPTGQKSRDDLSRRLKQAGFYGRSAMATFLVVKMLLVLGPPLIALLAGSLGLLPLPSSLYGGLVLGGLGLVMPSFYLDYRTRDFQKTLRRSLPDALDVMVICMEGGLSLEAALRKVTDELRSAHPLLARELDLIQRDLEFGRTLGEAFRRSGDRTGLDEIRSLGSVVVQAKKFGASMVNALRVHSDTLREKRQQRAEEQARKTATKLLFPTILCIFPGIFVVVMGPAAIQIMDMFKTLKN